MANAFLRFEDVPERLGDAPVGGVGGHPRRLDPWARTRLLVAAELCGAALAMVAVGSAGDRPTIFSDTTAYVRQGEYIATRLHLAAPLAPPRGLEQPTALSPTALAEFGPNFTTVAAARSPFYGFPLFILARIGSIWLVALVQALVAVWLLRLAASIVVPDRVRTAFWASASLLTLGSALPFFADFAMPDVFTGFALIALALLLVAPPSLRTTDRVALWATMTAALLFHRSNDATLIAVAVVGLVGLAWRGTSLNALARRGALVASGFAVVVVAGSLMQHAYHRNTGYWMGTPPFLAARILLDGPGKAYLAASCPGGAAPTFCRFKDRRMQDEDDVLWRARDGVFGSADYKDRSAMEREELGFVAASLRFAPGLALKAALGNWLEQLFLVFVDDPLGDPGVQYRHAGIDKPTLEHLYWRLAPCEAPGGCRILSTFHLRQAVFAIQAPVLALSVAVLFGIGLQARRLGRRRGSAAHGHDAGHLRTVIDAGCLILGGIVLNAAVCGILSAPSPRYQARVIWLLPMLAVLGLFAIRRARTAAQAPASSTC